MANCFQPHHITINFVYNFRYDIASKDFKKMVDINIPIRSWHVGLALKGKPYKHRIMLYISHLVYERQACMTHKIKNQLYIFGRLWYVFTINQQKNLHILMIL